MGARGAIIMGFFGACFASWTLYWQLSVRGVSLAAPFIIFVMIAFMAARVLRSPGQGIAPSKRVGKVIGWSSLGEGVVLLIAANVVMHFHRPDLLLPAMALVVGLHFLPIASVSRFRSFLFLGCGLIAASLIGAGMKQPLGGMIAGFAAAAGLWLAACFAIARDQRERSL